MSLLSSLKSKTSGSKFSTPVNFNYVLYKGLIPLLRALFSSFIIRGRIKLPLYLGKRVTVRNKHLLESGKGLYLGDYSYIDCLSKQGIKIGERVTIREFAWIQLTSTLSNPGEQISIGHHTYIGPRVVIGAAAPVFIGNNCQLGSGVNLIAENHQFSADQKIFDQEVTRKGIKIGDDCWIGNNVIILDGVEIGSGCVIGAGSVVSKSLPEKIVAAGIPAKIIKSR
ncbi:acyltransferase [Vibrio fortis]|uniref:acyltransferase n=1 Tax=Vibrio fortis TaxID=212667 RepID=UPI0021C2E67D|nr:acyltransferase [Vibrio fortis]